MPDMEETLKIFDINLRQHFYTEEVLCDSMRRCNILKINDEELLTVSRMFGLADFSVQETVPGIAGRNTTFGRSSSHVELMAAMCSLPEGSPSSILPM